MSFASKEWVQSLIKKSLVKKVSAIENDMSDAWDSETTYSAGDIVIHNDQLWKASLASTGEEPTDESSSWGSTTIKTELKSLNDALANYFPFPTYYGAYENFTPVELSAHKTAEVVTGVPWNNKKRVLFRYAMGAIMLNYYNTNGYLTFSLINPSGSGSITVNKLWFDY